MTISSMKLSQSVLSGDSISLVWDLECEQLTIGGAFVLRQEGEMLAKITGKKNVILQIICQASDRVAANDLANILAKEKILVNAVCPGPVHSDSWDENIIRVASERKISEAEAKILVENEEAAKIPLGVIGEGDQVASIVALLASPLSNWTTGSCFHINGGKMSNAF